MRKLLVAAGALATLLAVPQGHPRAAALNAPTMSVVRGQACEVRSAGHVAPAYLAVNDPCLETPAVGDARRAPAQFWMQANSPVLHLASGGSIDVTATITAGTNALTISPAIARAEWGTALGSRYSLTIPGTGSQSTITATSCSGTTINVASGGTSLVGGELIKDATNSGAVPPGTQVVSSTATQITTTQPVTCSSGDVIDYYVTATWSVSTVNSGSSVTLTGNVTNGLAGVPVTISFQPTVNQITVGAGNSSVNNGMQSFWRHGACTLPAGSNQLTCPTVPYSNTALSGTWAPDRDQTLGTSVSSLVALHSSVIVHDDSGTCPDLVAQILSSTATVATLDRNNGSCAFTGASGTDVYWGEVLATPTYNGSLTIAPGKAIEVPGVGAGSTQTAPAPLETTVASVTDPFTVTLANNAVVASQQVPTGAWLTWGTDDTAAVNAAANLVAAVSNPGYRYLYWPPNIHTFMASVNDSGDQVDGLFTVQRCGEGRLYYPTNADWLINTSPCMGVASWRPAKTMTASQTLKQVRSVTAASGTPTVGIVGDSWIATHNCQSSPHDCSEGWLEGAILTQNPALQPTILNYAIGGTTMGELDPLGPTYGYGPGLPGFTCATREDFYSANCSAQWMTLLEAASPAVDVWFMRMGANDNYSFSIGSFINVIDTMQSAAYHTATGRYPDIIVMPGSNNGYGGTGNGYNLTGGNSWYGMLAVAGVQRTMLRSGWFNTTMANHGAVGMIDLDDATATADQGFSLTKMPMHFARELLGYIRSGQQYAPTNFPYTWQSPVWGYAIYDRLQESGSLTTAQFYAAIGNGRCYGVGNGAAFTPQGAGTQTGNTFTTGYPGGAFCVDYNTSTGHWNVNRYLYRFTETPTCSYTSTTATLACSASVANYGHAGASIVACGTGLGTGTAPLFMGSLSDCITGTLKLGSGTGNGVSTDGKTLVLTANPSGGTTVASEAMTIMLYLEHPSDPTDTGCTPTTTQYGGNTLENFTFYAHSNGDVGISESVHFQLSAFEEQGEQCQWKGVMPAFLGNPFYPTLFTEDNATHNGIWYFGPQLGGGGNSQGFQQYASAWEESVDDTLLTPLWTVTESWGIDGDFGPFAGGSNQHTSSFGATHVYSHLFDAQDLNFVQ